MLFLLPMQPHGGLPKWWISRTLRAIDRRVAWWAKGWCKFLVFRPCFRPMICINNRAATRRVRCANGAKSQWCCGSCMGHWSSMADENRATMRRLLPCRNSPRSRSKSAWRNHKSPLDSRNRNRALGCRKHGLRNCPICNPILRLSWWARR